QAMLSTFPQLTTSEFNEACIQLQDKFQKQGHNQHVWTSVEIIDHHDGKYVRITKPLKNVPSTPTSTDKNDDLDEIRDTDDQSLPAPIPSPLINYDIILSPTYRVPTLYIHISDPLHRYPPTMSTLHSHLIPPEYRGQTDSAGVLGGVTITDHPVAGRPVFFIHPCQTAGVMQATVGEREVTAEEYLVMWIGALGGCVGLEVPLGLVREYGEY
ncbi:hypothetical protein J1614_012016, partial [Plenodomus biglobosus]